MAQKWQTDFSKKIVFASQEVFSFLVQPESKVKKKPLKYENGEKKIKIYDSDSKMMKPLTLKLRVRVIVSTFFFWVLSKDAQQGFLQVSQIFK